MDPEPLRLADSFFRETFRCPTWDDSKIEIASVDSSFDSSATEMLCCALGNATHILQLVAQAAVPRFPPRVGGPGRRWGALVLKASSLDAILRAEVAGVG